MENKDSKDILPEKERIAFFINSDNLTQTDILLAKYHVALESSEKRVKQMEEENNRLKGLLKDCHEHGEKYGVFETIKRYAPDEGINPDFLKFEDWCNKNNIKL